MNSKKFLLAVIFTIIIQSSSTAISIKDTTLFGAGVVFGIYCHEFGHAAVAVLEGGRVEEIGWKYTIASFDNKSGVSRLNALQSFAMGGYIAQTTLSEVILRNKSWHRNPFALGIMAMGIYTNANNAIAYFWGDRESDLSSFERSGGDAFVPAILLIGHAGLSVYRIFHETDIAPYVRNNLLGFELRF